MRKIRQLFSVFHSPLAHTNRNHLNGLDRVVTPRWDLGYLIHEVEVLVDLAENRVSRWRGPIKPIKVRIVSNIDEKLGSPRFRLASIGHGESSNVIGNSLVRLTNLVGDASVMGPCVRLAIASLEGRSSLRAASARSRAAGVFRVWAAKLIHEVWDNTVEVNAVVKATVSKVNKVATGNGHLVRVELGFESAHGCNKGSGRHGYGLQVSRNKVGWASLFAVVTVTTDDDSSWECVPCVLG